MKLFADYHTHTVYSHGKGTIYENVMEAKRKGLKEIAITDHGPRHFGFGVKLYKIEKIRREIDEINASEKDVKVLMGIEANIISEEGDIDLPVEYLKYIDILLVGFHYGVIPKSFKSAWRLFGLNYLGKIIRFLRNRVREINTLALIRAIERYPVKIITHPGAKVPIDTKLLAKKAAEKGVALEINASHGFMTVEYVKIAKREGALFSIGSDAHRPEDVGSFERAIRIAEEAGLTASDVINACKV